MKNVMLREIPPVIRTERLEMRHLTLADQQDMVEMLRNEQIRRTYMIPDFPTEAAAVNMFRIFQEMSVSQEHFIYGAYVDWRLVGFLNDVKIGAETIEVGYVVNPEFHNRGYATEMLGGAIRALFAMGFTAVRAGFFEENIASRRVMEKNGMRPTGETEMIKYRGAEHRCILFEIRA